ncbi:MAG TPA: hypothetical protein VHU24_03220 [Solirubrobacterales bacterium]|jgi:hypothetical protein|nr:hypothetical protein [Solirubrobacterales bacterium]
MASDSGVSAEDFAKLQTIAEQANKTAEEAKTAAEARADVKETVQEEGEAQGLEVDEQTAELLANAVVSQLEARGAFGAPAVEPAAADPTVPDPAAAAVPPAAPAAPAPAVASEPPAADPIGPGDEQRPARKSLAERFQGR